PHGQRLHTPTHATPIGPRSVPCGLLLVCMFWGGAFAAACDSGDVLRFRDGVEWYRFEGQPVTVEFSGARLIETSPEVQSFDCPSGQTLFGEIPVFKVDATTP